MTIKSTSMKGCLCDGIRMCECVHLMIMSNTFYFWLTTISIDKEWIKEFQLIRIKENHWHFSGSCYKETTHPFSSETLLALLPSSSRSVFFRFPLSIPGSRTGYLNVWTVITLNGKWDYHHPVNLVNYCWDLFALDLW